MPRKAKAPVKAKAPAPHIIDPAEVERAIEKRLAAVKETHPPTELPSLDQAETPWTQHLGN